MSDRYQIRFEFKNRSWIIDDEETLTAYHEAGHAVIGFVLGGKIERIQLGGEGNDNLPLRYGDCVINWGPVQSHIDWQLQREILTILAGPVAEMIYRGEKLHPALFGPWQSDWQTALLLCPANSANQEHASKVLELLICELFSRMSSDVCWAAIAAVADELLTHDYLEHDQLVGHLEFWLSR